MLLQCVNASHLGFSYMACHVFFSVALPALHALQLSEAPEAWLVPTSQGTQM